MMRCCKLIPGLALMGLAALTLAAFAPAAPAAEPGQEGRDQAMAALDEHIAVLEDVKAQVPDEAKDAIQRAIDESEVLLDDVRQSAADGDPADGQPTLDEALAAVDEGTQRHIAVLEGLLEREDLPDKARDAISTALDVSANGRMVAMQRLEMLRSGETPRGRPDIVRPSNVRPAGVRPDTSRPDLPADRPTPPAGRGGRP